MKFALREPMNGFTHFLGIIFSIMVIILLPSAANTEGSPLFTTTYLIFGTAMFMLFTASTLYHWLPADGKKLELLRKIDHIMIFVFIAASYTPVCMITLKGAWGYSILAVVWLAAAGGFFMKIFWLNAPRKLYTGIYLLMGWVVIAGIYPLINALSAAGMMWLAAEGVLYTTGAFIYAFRKPDPLPGILGFHEIFHLFILAGAFCQFMVIYRYV